MDLCFRISLLINVDYNNRQVSFPLFFSVIIFALLLLFDRDVLFCLLLFWKFGELMMVFVKLFINKLLGTLSSKAPIARIILLANRESKINTPRASDMKKWLTKATMISALSLSHWCDANLFLDARQCGIQAKGKFLCFHSNPAFPKHGLTQKISGASRPLQIDAYTMLNCMKTKPRKIVNVNITKTL